MLLGELAKLGNEVCFSYAMLIANAKVSIITAVTTFARASHPVTALWAHSRRKVIFCR